MKDEALRLALKALETMKSYGNVFLHKRNEQNPFDQVCEAITAIKQALEQPEPEPEPVPQLGDGIFWCDTCKSVQEHPDHAENDIWCKGQATWIQGPFYTSPPKREPLTEEQMDAVIDGCPKYHGLFSTKDPNGEINYYQLIRATEAAHGIKGEA
jgi:hypothetical protein